MIPARASGTPERARPGQGGEAGRRGVAVTASASAPARPCVVVRTGSFHVDTLVVALAVVHAVVSRKLSTVGPGLQFAEGVSNFSGDSGGLTVRGEIELNQTPQ